MKKFIEWLKKVWEWLKKSTNKLWRWLTMAFQWLKEAFKKVINYFGREGLEILKDSILFFLVLKIVFPLIFVFIISSIFFILKKSELAKIKQSIAWLTGSSLGLLIFLLLV